MTDQKAKRWSRVVIGVCGVLLALSSLPVDILGWIKLVAGLTMSGTSAYWSNSDKIGERKDEIS